MDTFHYTTSGGFVLGGEGKYSVSVPTCNTIYDDIVYTLGKAKLANTDHKISKCYARIAIIFLAFYMESLINLLLDEMLKNNCPEKFSDFYINRERTLQKYQDALYIISKKKLPNQDTDCISDLFSIRNHLIAHPKAREIVGGTDVPKGKGLSGKGEPIKYKKFKHFPNILSEFTYKHAQELYNGIKEFLMKYYSLIDKDLNGHWIASYFHLKNI
jgi:hypothetical protein